MVTKENVQLFSTTSIEHKSGMQHSGVFSKDSIFMVFQFRL